AGEADIFRVTVAAGLVIQTPAGPLGTATRGTFFSRQIVATGGVPAYTWSLSASPDLPPLSFDSVSGVLSGVVRETAALQTDTFTITVTDAAGTSLSRIYSILVNNHSG